MFKKSMSDLFKLPKEQLNQFLDSFDTVLTDCDGVLWKSGGEIPGSALAINKFKEMGKKVFYITNNSTKCRTDIVVHAKSLGFEAEEDEVISTSYLTASYLKNRNFEGKCYIIGSEGLADELDKFGIRYVGIGPDEGSTMQECLKFRIDPEVNCVIVGMDRYFSYKKMTKAATYLANPQVLFIGTNTDERFPSDGPVVIPGTGSLVRAIECCSLRKAKIMGKPNNFIGKLLVKEYGLKPERCLMIGDRCNTDILFGTRCNFQTLLVLSGVTSLNEVQEYKKSDKHEDLELVPDLYLGTLGDINYIL